MQRSSVAVLKRCSMKPEVTARTTANPVSPDDAFVRRELLFVIIGVAILGSVFLPSLFRGKGKVDRTNCTQRLKHIALSFNLWADTHNELFPMQYNIDTNEWAPLEFASATNSYFHFQVLSNQLRMASILTCPADKQRTFTTNFTTGFDSRHISYFIGLNAGKKHPASFLAGDRNISNGTPLRKGVLELTPNQTVSWTKELHGEIGNIALADGSVLQLNNRQLKKALASTGSTTNRLAIP